LIHTAAYWLMLTLRGLAPRTSFWRDAAIRHDPPEPDQSRHARDRDGHPHQDRPADSIPYRARFTMLTGQIAKLPP
jgi:hypothetical protein